jgi:hypothetical protein
MVYKLYQISRARARRNTRPKTCGRIRESYTNYETSLKWQGSLAAVIVRLSFYFFKDLRNLIRASRK